MFVSPLKSRRRCGYRCGPGQEPTDSFEAGLVELPDELAGLAMDGLVGRESGPQVHLFEVVVHAMVVVEDRQVAGVAHGERR